MSKMAKEVNEQIEYGIDKLPDDRFVNINLKDFMFFYKAIEEFRGFFHNRDHYPLLNDVHTYIGNSKNGVFSILNKLYYQTLNKYLPDDIENPSEENEERLTHPNSPYYYQLKAENKYRLTLTEKVETPILALIKEMGFEVTKQNNTLKAENYNTEFKADTPSQLLGLISLYRAKGSSKIEE
jgi:hypothetical protein